MKEKKQELPLLLERAFTAIWSVLRRIKRTLHFDLRLSWLAVLTTCLLAVLYVASHLTRTDSVVWVPPDSCHDCVLIDPFPLSQLRSNLLLILIHASAWNRARRDAIRKTWVSLLDNSQHSPIQYRFVLGGKDISEDVVTAVSKEARITKDLIFLDQVTDSKLTLTARTLDGFVFSDANFEFDYVLKCDDDSFADILRIATELQLRTSKTRLYWGQHRGGVSLLFFGTYRETSWYVCDRYLPYTLGGGYVLSRDLIKLLAMNQEYLKQYKCEDVSVGAWLAPYNIERVHDVRFNTATPSKGCKSPFLISHKVSEDDMVLMYESLMTEGTICSWRNQWQAGVGFVYNWTSLPSYCCLKHLGVP